jgi:hypothetical protein
LFAGRVFRSGAPRASSSWSFDRLATCPALRKAGAGSSLPLAARIGAGDRRPYRAGTAADDGKAGKRAGVHCHAGLLESLDIALARPAFHRGSDDERSAGPPGGHRERAPARQFWPDDRDGQRLLRFPAPPSAASVCRRFRDVRRELAQAAALSLYVPHAQSPTGSITFVVPRAAMHSFCCLQSDSTSQK